MNPVRSWWYSWQGVYHWLTFSWVRTGWASWKDWLERQGSMFTCLGQSLCVSRPVKVQSVVTVSGADPVGGGGGPFCPTM